jgi:endo-1,3-1,4-beta-glycanase ExoK
LECVARLAPKNIPDRGFIAAGCYNANWITTEWRRTAVDVKPDLATLQLKKGPQGSKFALQGGELQTHARHRYGYFEIRMKVPRGAGIVTGFFSYAGQDGRTRPHEIDIEILGRNTRVAELTIHQGGRPTSTKVTLPFDSADGFHTYGFDWQPGHVRWYADGKLIHAETGEAARRLTRPQQLMVNLWASRELGAWVGTLDIGKAPWRLDIACIAYQPVYAGPVCS